MPHTQTNLHTLQGHEIDDYWVHGDRLLFGSCKIETTEETSGKHVGSSWKDKLSDYVQAFFLTEMGMRCPFIVHPQQKCPHLAPLLKAVVTHNLMH